MKQSGLFDLEFRLHKIDKNGDPLKRLNQLIDWEAFHPILKKIRKKDNKSKAGRKPFDSVLMFKILILQSLYNLSDDATEAHILDRLSFMRFLGLTIGDRVPDSKTIWLFREQLQESGVLEKLFTHFDDFLRQHGFEARRGQIVDASIVSVPKQRNTLSDNKKIKSGEEIPEWNDPKRRQKDTDARWTKKNRKFYYGYKNHISIDVKHKFVRKFSVTSASVHDSQVFKELLDDQNTSGAVWADSAYRSMKNLVHLGLNCYREHIQRKGSRNKKLTAREKQGNRSRSRIRSRIEHVFGVQAQKAGNLILRTVGIRRAWIKIGLRDLAYNLDRYSILAS
jgi:transposase, IS5 family